MNRFKNLGCFQHIQWNPGAHDLRLFAAVMLVGFGILGALAAFKAGQIGSASILLWSAGVALAVAGLTPGLGRLAYLAVYVVSGVAGWIVSHTLLLLLFYLVFTPIGLLLRMLGTDPLQLRLQPGTGAWRESRRISGTERYYRQF